MWWLRFGGMEDAKASWPPTSQNGFEIQSTEIYSISPLELVSGLPRLNSFPCKYFRENNRLPFRSDRAEPADDSWNANQLKLGLKDFKRIFNKM